MLKLIAIYFTCVLSILLYILTCVYPEDFFNKGMASKSLVSVDFEVFGRVQGVFFRKYTQQEGSKLGLKGWCMNTHGGTVKGVMEGEPRQVEAMKKWLQVTGSPQSKIEKAVFNNEKNIDKYSFSDFKINY